MLMTPLPISANFPSSATIISDLLTAAPQAPPDMMTQQPGDQYTQHNFRPP